MRRSGVGVLVLVLGVLAGPAVAQTGNDAAEIAGTVRAADTGETLAGLCVLAYDLDLGLLAGFAATDEDGSYVLTGLAPGRYAVEFNGCLLPFPGVAYEWWPVGASVAEAVPISVEAGARVDAIDASLPTAGLLSGITADEGSGEPVEGICVEAIEVGTGGAASTFSIGGDYVFTNLRPGSYAVVFVDCFPPYVHISETYDGIPYTGLNAPPPDLTLVPVAAGEETTGVDASLGLGGAITGVVRGAHHGREQPLVCVAAWAAETLDGGGTVPDFSELSGQGPILFAGELGGSYVLGGLPAGRYAVEFNAGPCQDDGYARQFHPGTGRSTAQLVTVGSGTTVSGVDASLVPSPSTAHVCGDVPEDGFADVPQDGPHEATIDCAVALGLVAGRADGTFGPGEVLTRGQVASLLARAITLQGGELPAAPGDLFTDDDGSVHEAALNQLAAVGIIRGDGAGRVSPEARISRDQLATLLVETYEHVLGFKLGWTRDHFDDDAGSAHERTINRAATAGFVTARASGGYEPAGVVLRDEMATALVRLVDRLSRDALSGATTQTIGTASITPHSAPTRHPLTVARTLLDQLP